MANILKKICLARKESKKPAHKFEHKNYKEIKQAAIDSTKRLIQCKIDELKTRHGYRDLTKHEQCKHNISISST